MRICGWTICFEGTEPNKPDPIRSLEMDLSRACWDFAREMDNPVPDPVFRKMLRDRIRDKRAALLAMGYDPK